MPKICFEASKHIVQFHSPLKNGELETQSLEIRRDPLTGYQSVLNEAFRDKIAFAFPQTDYDYLHQRMEDTIGQCFMCEGKWRLASPRYPRELLARGRLEKGQCALFPNLFPIAPYHAVVMVGEKHGRTLEDFSPALLFDALSISLEFIGRCFEVDPKCEFFTINANFMPPAGSSIMHPHLQIIGSPMPSSHLRVLLENGLAYHRKNGSCYFTDLIETERQAGERWLGEIGQSGWFTAFSPLGVNEVNAVWPNRSNFMQWGEEDLHMMAEGLSHTLAAYHDLKFSTFNLSCFSGPLGKELPEFRCLLRLVNRQNMHPHYRTDDFYLQKLLKDEMIVYPPEQLASLIRQGFR